jgi:hypothetical protein
MYSGLLNGNPPEGLPYQTLIASLLHKYATGRLKEISISALTRVRIVLRRSFPNPRRCRFR